MSTTARSSSNDRQSGASPRSRRAAPPSLESVRSRATSVVGSLNSRVESAHERHRWQELLTQPEVAQLHGLVHGVRGRHRSFKEFSALLKADGREIPDDARQLLQRVGALFDEFRAKVLRGAVAQVSESLLNGIVRFCLPLAELASCEIPCVLKYEKDHFRLDGDVNRDLGDLLAAAVELERLSFPKFLKSPTQSCELLKKVRAAVNRLYYTINEWADCDRAYVEELEEQLQQDEQRLRQVEADMQAASGDVQDERQLKKMLEDAEKLEEKSRQLRTQTSRCNASIASSRARLKNVESDLQQKRQQRDRLQQKKQRLQQQQQQQPSQRTQQELSWTAQEERETLQELQKQRDTAASLQRYAKHLEASKAGGESEQKAASDRAARLRAQHETARQRHEAAVQRLETLQAERLELLPRIDDLKLLRDKKSSAESIKEIHSVGHVSSPRKTRKPLAAACGDVAAKIGTGWRDLYAQLPMEPDRTQSTRRRDVERLDVMGGRHDLPEAELAALSLEKWRLFCPQSRTDGLVKALKKIDRQEMAQEIGQKFKYKKE